MKTPLHFLAILVFVCATTVRAQTGSEDAMSGLIKETQHMIDDGERLSLIWWIPNEFWQRSLAKNPRVTADQAQDIVRALEDYTLVAVVDAKKGGLAVFTYTPADEIRKSATLITPAGNKLSPVDDSDLTPAAKNL